MADRPHGYARYKLDGCRCYTCGWAVAQYRDRCEQLRRRGQWQPFVDAEPVRAHVLALKSCGLGDRRIAELASLDRKRVRELLHGRPERGTPPPAQIRPATATALLQVEATFGNLPDKLVIDAAGTVRRVQALVAAGWPQHWIAERLGWTDGNLSVLLRRKQTIVRTARAVRALYADMWHSDPVVAGVDNQARARAINHARANGWAPAGAWDEDTIDDLAAEPEWTGACGTPEGYNVHRRAGIPMCQRCRSANYARMQERAAQQPVPPVPSLGGPAAHPEPKAPRLPAACGTRGGYQRHRRLGEEACEPCRIANTQADRRLRETGTTKSAA